MRYISLLTSIPSDIIPNPRKKIKKNKSGRKGKVKLRGPVNFTLPVGVNIKRTVVNNPGNVNINHQCKQKKAKSIEYMNVLHKKLPPAKRLKKLVTCINYHNSLVTNVSETFTNVRTIRMGEIGNSLTNIKHSLNVTITYDQMLAIRKKRLNYKSQKNVQSNINELLNDYKLFKSKLEDSIDVSDKGDRSEDKLDLSVKETVVDNSIIIIDDSVTENINHSENEIIYVEDSIMESNNFCSENEIHNKENNLTDHQDKMNVIPTYLVECNKNSQHSSSDNCSIGNKCDNQDLINSSVIIIDDDDKNKSDDVIFMSYNKRKSSLVKEPETKKLKKSIDNTECVTNRVNIGPNIVITTADSEQVRKISVISNNRKVTKPKMKKNQEENHGKDNIEVVPDERKIMQNVLAEVNNPYNAYLQSLSTYNTFDMNWFSFCSDNANGNMLNNQKQNYSFGNNFYNAGVVRRAGLRVIIIDGSNVAMSHSNGKFFSVKGLKICIDYFLRRGHEVKAFVPQFRVTVGQSSDQNLLNRLNKQGHVIFTPSRKVQGRFIVPYDDRFIVQSAAELEAVIVSSDNYRDLMRENPHLIETIEKRLLMPTWINDMIIFPPDPLGRSGPHLDDFLRFP